MRNPLFPSCFQSFLPLHTCTEWSFRLGKLIEELLHYVVEDSRAEQSRAEQWAGTSVYGITRMEKKGCENLKKKREGRVSE